MDFTIYTFGDVEVFRAALAGVAMVFDSTGFFVGEGGLGLGAVAGLGLLLGLVVMLIQGVIDQRVQLGGFIMAMVLFVILFVPKFSVNIEDYNGDAIAKVDDVPLGVAMPAALVSGLAREMNIRMGTAFSTVDGYPSGLNTPGALTSPLKMLFALRYAAPHTRDRITREMSNLQNLVAYCVAGRGNNYNIWTSGRISDNQIARILAQAAESKGLTMYTEASATSASLHSCEAAAGWVEADIDAFMEPTGRSSAVMTAAAATKGAAPVKIINNKAMIEPITTETQDQAMKMLFQTSSNDAYNFMKMAMFMPSVNKALDCAGPSGDPSAWAQCIPFQQGTIQFSEDAAAAGTFFQRLMFHGMNALFFIWICLSPVVAMVMLILGIKGMKLAGSYLMFGAWAVSWYVGASIVNFYMLKQVQYEVAMLGQIEGLTQTGIGQFFDVLQNKIAVSGDMMASVPLIMMTVMTGSVYGMTQLASRWGAKDYYDQNVNAPPYMSNAALYQRESMAPVNYRSELGVGPAIGATAAPVLNNGAILQNAVSDAEKTEHSLANSQQASVMKALQQTMQSGKMGEIGGTLSHGLRSSGASGLASVTSLQEAINNNKSIDISERRQLAESVSASLNPKIGGVGAGFELSSDRIKALGLSETDSTTLQKLSTGSTEFHAQLVKEAGSQSMTKFASTGSMIDAATNSSNWGETQQIVDQHSTAHQTLQTLSSAAGISQVTDFGLIGRQIDQNPLAHPAAVAINTAAAPLLEKPEFKASVDAIASTYGQNALMDFSPATKQTLATLHALSQHHPVEFAQAVAQLHGTAALKVGAGEHQTPEVGTVMQAGAVKGAPKGTEANANAGATTIQHSDNAVKRGDTQVAQTYANEANRVIADQPKKEASSARHEATVKARKEDPVGRNDSLIVGQIVRTGEAASDAVKRIFTATPGKDKK